MISRSNQRCRQRYEVAGGSLGLVGITMWRETILSLKSWAACIWWLVCRRISFCVQANDRRCSSARGRREGEGTLSATAFWWDCRLVFCIVHNGWWCSLIDVGASIWQEVEAAWDVLPRMAPVHFLTLVVTQIIHPDAYMALESWEHSSHSHFCPLHSIC